MAVDAGSAGSVSSIAVDASPRPAPDADGIASAREKFHCPACGAEAHWNPRGRPWSVRSAGPYLPQSFKRAAPTPLSSNTILSRHSEAFPTRLAAGRQRRHPSDAKAARQFQSSTPIRSDGVATSAAQPSSCRTPRSKTLSARNRSLAFKVSESQARDLLRSWFHHLWLAPNKLKSRRSLIWRKVSTCPTGPSMRMHTPTGPPRRVITTTTPLEANACAEFVGAACLVNSSTFLMISLYRRRGASTPNGCAA